MSRWPVLAPTPGKYPLITAAQYFAEICSAPAFTNSLCRVLIDETPKDAAYLHPAIGAPPDSVATTVEKRRGDIVHQLALGKGRGYMIGEYDAWRSAEAKEFKKQAEDLNLTPVKREEFNEAEKMAAVLRANIPDALNGIAADRNLPAKDYAYETEVVFVCTFDIDGTEIWARIMVDVWCEELLVALDPKTTKYLTDKRAPAHIGNMGWDTQAAFYSRVIEATNDAWAGRVVFADLMVKPVAPYTSRTVAIPESWKTTANMDIDHAMRIFAKCIEADDWPGYAPGIHYMQQPSWAQKDALERAMEEEGDGA